MSMTHRQQAVIIDGTILIAAFNPSMPLEQCAQRAIDAKHAACQALNAKTQAKKAKPKAKRRAKKKAAK